MLELTVPWEEGMEEVYLQKRAVNDELKNNCQKEAGDPSIGPWRSGLCRPVCFVKHMLHSESWERDEKKSHFYYDRQSFKMALAKEGRSRSDESHSGCLGKGV